MFFLIIFLFLISYIIGAIPTGYWFAKLCYGVDVRQKGSGNIGATNVARVLGGKKFFFLIFILDFSKAFAYLYFVNLFNCLDNILFLLLAIALLIGNAYSIFLYFNGGKGVAITVGILGFLNPFLLLIFLVTWATILFIKERVDCASLGAMIFVLFFYFLFYKPFDVIFFLFLSFLFSWLVFRHKNNIKDLFFSSNTNNL